MQIDPPRTAADKELYSLPGAQIETQGGSHPFNRDACIAAHPDQAEALRRFFEDQDRIGSDRPPHPVMTETDPTLETLSHAGNWPLRFGEHELLSEIARGGMGIVYEARHLRLNRIVALKMIRDRHLAGETERQRFRIEAEAAASLDHPNIVPVFEVGEHDGTVYFTMKRIEGCDLSRRLGAYAAEPREAAMLMAKAARAVQHAHESGILHRDLKPSNILIDMQGEPHLTDFGLAKRLETDGDLTLSGMLIGTPEYVSPEQAAGSVRAITTATDVYGLGAVLYALLTRRPPFHGRSMLETLQQVREDSPAPPSRLAGRLDHDLETICLKCLEKSPGSRYAQASALADDLERWLRGEPILARPVRWWERASRWCRRNPAVAALSGAMAVFGISALIAGILMVDRISRERSEAVVQSMRAGVNIRHALHGISRLHSRVQDRGLDHLPEVAALRRDISRQSIALFQSIIDEGQPEPSVGADIASALQHIAVLQFNDGYLAEADAAMSRSTALLEGLVSLRPDDSGLLYLSAQSHHILALQHAASGRIDDVSEHCAVAERAYRRCVTLKPDDYDSLNGTSWFLAIAPDPCFRAPDEAATLARRGVALFPRSAAMWNDLGVALYRCGRWAEAVDSLQMAQRLRNDPENAHDGFFLCMALVKLDRVGEARERFVQAAAWMDRNDPRHHELRLFRAEALGVLGIRGLDAGQW